MEVLPVTTAVVERSFSSIKTKLRSRMGADTLDSTMRTYVLRAQILFLIEAVVDHYKRVKNRKMAL